MLSRSAYRIRLSGFPRGVYPMPKTELDPLARDWTAADLRRLPAHERDAILVAAAELAVEHYTHDPQLTAFEAFSGDDMHRHSSDTQPR